MFSLLSYQISFVIVPEIMLNFHLALNLNTEQHDDLKDQQWNRVLFRLRVNTSKEQGLPTGDLILIY